MLNTDEPWKHAEVKEVSHRRPRTEWFHLNEMTKIGKDKVDWWWPGVRRGGNKKSVTGVSLGVIKML